MPNLSHGTILDTMVTHTLMVDTTDTHTTTLERDLLMLNQNQKLKLSHGTDIEDITGMVVTHTDMAMDTTEVRDLLMPKLHQKPNHGTAIVDIMVTGTHTDTDMDMDTMDKSLLHFRQEQFFPEFKNFSCLWQTIFVISP